MILYNGYSITIGGGDEAVSITGNTDGNGAGLEVGKFDKGIEIKDNATLKGGGSAAGLAITTDTSSNTTGVVISGGTITSESGSNAISLDANGATVTITGGSLDDKAIISTVTDAGESTTVRLGANIGASAIGGDSG